MLQSRVADPEFSSVESKFVFFFFLEGRIRICSFYAGGYNPGFPGDSDSDPVFEGRIRSITPRIHNSRRRSRQKVIFSAASTLIKAVRI